MSLLRIFFVNIALLHCFFIVSGQPVRAADRDDGPDKLQQSLSRVLATQPTSRLGFTKFQAEPSAVDRVLLNMYLQHNSRPYWVSNAGPGQKAAALLSVLNTADQDGLNPDHYRLRAIHDLWQSRKPADLAALDVMLTLAMGSYVTDMREGRAAACLLDPKLFAAARDQQVDITEVVRQALTTPDLVSFLRQQAPQHFAYQSLKKTLAAYRVFATRGGWQPIPAGKVLKPGMKDERLALLVDRLTMTADLKATGRPPTTYDGPIVKAVKHFQYRYNLKQDGIIGRATLAALNIPVQDHLRRIIINMERWRWLPHTLDGQRILVNIAGFHLAGIRDEQLEITMPVIVGKTYHKTPVFSHIMRYIEFNPYWNIPNSIAVNEMVPKMINDPQYLQREGIRILDGWQQKAREIDPATIDWQSIGKGIKKYRLRQDSGPNNALGVVKFMFPNRYNVYMHDTPAHGLFEQNNRSFSHGCIRVSRALELALYILKQDDQGWSKERINALINTGKRKVVPLKKPIPVHILYRTVLVDPRDNTVHFYDDVYGRDSLLARALFTGTQPIQCRYSTN